MAGPPPPSHPLPPPEDPAIQDMENRIYNLEHPRCTSEQWLQRTGGFLGGAIATTGGLGFVETPLGWIAVGGGALAMLGSGDMVIQCLEGELN
jgi:hypothetical protein